MYLALLAVSKNFQATAEIYRRSSNCNFKTFTAVITFLEIFGWRRLIQFCLSPEFGIGDSLMICWYTTPLERLLYLDPFRPTVRAVQSRTTSPGGGDASDPPSQSFSQIKIDLGGELQIQVCGIFLGLHVCSACSRVRPRSIIWLALLSSSHQEEKTRQAIRPTKTGSPPLIRLIHKTRAAAIPEKLKRRQ